MPILMAAGGYVAAEMLLPKVLGSQSPKTRALAAGGLGLVLPMFMPQLAPVALGVGIQGAVTLGRDLLALPQPGGRIGALSPADRKALRRFADSGMVNGDDSRYINGTSGMLNGFEANASTFIDPRDN